MRGSRPHGRAAARGSKPAPAVCRVSGPQPATCSGASQAILATGIGSLDPARLSHKNIHTLMPVTPEQPRAARIIQKDAETELPVKVMGNKKRGVKAKCAECASTKSAPGGQCTTQQQ
ncbi:hypothetical protein HaLaN_32548, partial [Haematococcus lacustris]